jgi:hypothetical protein
MNGWMDGWMEETKNKREERRRKGEREGERKKEGRKKEGRKEGGREGWVMNVVTYSLLLRKIFLYFLIVFLKVTNLQRQLVGKREIGPPLSK